MPKLFSEDNEIIDLSNINPNKMFAMSYNYELLKYVITSLIRNQQNMDNQYNDLRLSFLKQQKYATELEMSIIELKMQKEETPEVLEELLNKKKELKSKIEQYQKEIDLLSEEKEKNKKKIPIYSMKPQKKEENFENFNEDFMTDINIIQKNDLDDEKEKEKENENEKEEENDKIKIDKIIKTNEQENEKDKNKEKDKDKEKEREKEEESQKDKEKEIQKEKEKEKDKEKEDEKKKIEEKKDIEKAENIKKEEKIEEKKIEDTKIEEKKVIAPPVPKTMTSSKTIGKEKPSNKNEDFHKELQLIVGELKNIKSKQQTLDKDFSLFKSNITEQINHKFRNEIPTLIENTFENKIVLIQKNTKRDLDKINEDINNINNDFEQKFSDLNNNILKEISLKDEKNNQDFEQIKNNFNTLKENFSLTNEKLSNMVTTLSFNNLKKEITELIENEKKGINLEISILKSTLNNTKNQLFDHLSDSRDHDNIISLMKIMDSISLNIQKLMEFKKLIEEKDKRKVIADNNKYVKQEGFNEAINSIHKHMDSNKKEFSEIRLDIDSIRTKDLNVKANLRDLKNLEDSIFTKMDALKETIRDNFVEKNMLVKNLKYLELQTKQLIEENKKNEKQESWLLAKKPFNAHLCASCEAYLGDLKPNTNSKFIPWNKYPAKDSIDKIFRINAGFSKVLQMVNQGNLKNERSKSNSLNNSKEERNCTSAEADRKKNQSYKSKNKDKHIKQNNSCTQIDDNDFVGTLPKISVKKNNKLSTDNIFDDTNGRYNKNFNTGKISASSITRKSRKLVDENDDENKNNKKVEIDDDNENKELQKPKITKVFRKIGDNIDKKDNE